MEKGYKVFNSDWTCRDFQYEVGKTFKIDGEPKLCNHGFHYCPKLIDCFCYYQFNPNNKVAEIEAIGDIDGGDGDKHCTNKIKIVRELSWFEVLSIVNSGDGNTGLDNSGDYNSGYYNSGYYNSGDSNSGDRNSGNYNSGNRNSGNYNSGDSNSGDRNSGNYNSGDSNSGNYNSGNRNSGNRNSGNRNSGDRNSGNYNSGNYNSGDRNSGNYNSGDSNSGNYNSGDSNSGNYNSGNSNSGYYNSGNRNSGDYNSGYMNSGNHHSGAFNTEENPTIKLFDKESNMTWEDFCFSDACSILNTCPQTYSSFILASEMSEEEKEVHPEYKTLGGYVKKFEVTKEDKQKWWDELSEDKKETVKALPNFDSEKFCKCVSIYHV